MKKTKLCRIAALVLAFTMLAAMPAGALTWDEEGNEITVIVLDPGHGGIDSGAVAEHDSTKVYESELVLKIAEYCRDYLEDNYWNVQVHLTRETDERVTLEDRVAFAGEVGADYLLSIHLNTSGTGNARGALALVPRGKYRPEQAQASVTTAEAILENLAALGLTNRGTVVETTDLERYPDGSDADSYKIVRYCVRADIPGVIMEHCFLDSSKDYQAVLSSEEKLKALGIADALGLAETLGLEPMSERPRDTSAEMGDTPFEDVYVGEWFYDDVTYVWEQGLMQGISDTEFGPANPANRAMVVTLLYRMDGAEYIPEGSSFTDVPEGSWYHAPVEWALANGITTGVTATEFAPGQNVVREQFVTFLYRYAGQPEVAGEPEGFTDWEEVGKYARNAVAWAVEEGLLTGYSDGTVRPKRELNRAELAVLMHRFHRWWLHETGELTYEWTQSHLDKTLYVGESFELTLTNQYGETAEAVWTADTEGVVEINGSTVTAVGVGTALLSCEVDGGIYECLVDVTELVYEWEISALEKSLYVGESFELTVMNQFEEKADVTWTADTEGVVQIDGSTVTAVGVGTALLSCEIDGEVFDCLVTVSEEVDVWTISHTDVTIKVGESFNLRVRNQDGVMADVTWSASKSGYVTISGNKITGAAKGTVTVRCEYEGQTFECIVRVKNA